MHLLVVRLVEHCANVLNRYNIGAEGRTPLLRLQGRTFVENMWDFVSSVMFRVSGKVLGGVTQERWFPGIWLGKMLRTEGHLVMEEDGLEVRSRARREKSQTLTMEDYDKLVSTSHDPTGTVKAASTRTVLPEVRAQEQELGSYKPQRAKITKNIIEKFGPTAKCTMRRRAITREDSGMEAVGHSAACQGRVEDMINANPEVRDRVTELMSGVTICWQSTWRRMTRKHVRRHNQRSGQGQASSTAKGLRDPIPQQETDGDAEMGVPEAIAETCKKNTG